MKYITILILFFLHLAAHAQLDVYLCTSANGNKEYKTTGNTNGCEKVDLPGVTLSKNWVYIDKIKDSMTTYVDKETFIIGKEFRKAWVLRNFHAGQSTKTLELFKCSTKESAVARVIEYTGSNGAGDPKILIDLPAGEAVFTEVAPNSIGAFTLKQICEIRCTAKGCF